MKEKAVVEYETFLKKMPDYSDRKKLQDYINLSKEVICLGPWQLKPAHDRFQ